MKHNEKDFLTIKYTIFTLLAVVTSFLLHEVFHWITGQALGYNMILTLNKVYPKNLSYVHDWHFTLISAVGPLVTLAQAVFVYFLLRKTSNLYFYPFIFAASYLELLSGIMNVSRPNDLGRISQTFGLGLFVIPIIFVFVHLYVIFKTSKKQGYSSKFNGLTLFLVLLFSSIWILANQRFNIVLIG
jgi:hypothetical protein